METDYYSQGSESTDSPTGDGTAKPPTEDTAPEKDSALLPRSFFKDKELEVGAERKVRVEHVYDDDVEVSYVKHGDTEKSEMDTALSGMDSMAEPEE